MVIQTYAHIASPLLGQRRPSLLKASLYGLSNFSRTAYCGGPITLSNLKKKSDSPFCYLNCRELKNALGTREYWKGEAGTKNRMSRNQNQWKP